MKKYLLLAIIFVTYMHLICMQQYGCPEEYNINLLKVNLSYDDIDEKSDIEWQQIKVVSVSKTRCLIVAYDKYKLVARFLFYDITNKNVIASITVTNGNYIIADDCLLFINIIYISTREKISDIKIPQGYIVVMAIDDNINTIKPIAIDYENSMYAGPEGYTRYYSKRWWVLYSKETIILIERKTNKCIKLKAIYENRSRIAISDLFVVIIEEDNGNNAESGMYCNKKYNEYYNNKVLMIDAITTRYIFTYNTEEEWQKLPADITKYISDDGEYSITPTYNGFVLVEKHKSTYCSMIYECKGEDIVLRNIIDGYAVCFMYCGELYIFLDNIVCDSIINKRHIGYNIRTVFDLDLNYIIHGIRKVNDVNDRTTIAASKYNRIETGTSNWIYYVDEYVLGEQKNIIDGADSPKCSYIIKDHYVYVKINDDKIVKNNFEVNIRIMKINEGYIPIYQFMYNRMTL